MSSFEIFQSILAAAIPVFAVLSALSLKNALKRYCCVQASKHNEQ